MTRFRFAPPGLSFLIALALAAPAATFAIPQARAASAADSAADSTGAVAAAPDSAAADTAGLARAAALLDQADAASPETLAVAPRVSVPVFLGGREVFRVGGGRDGLDAEARAAAIRARLNAAVRDLDVPTDSVRLLSTPQGVEVRLGRHFLWLITPEDVAELDAAGIAAMMAAIPADVTAGIERERAGRRPLGILISVLIALGVTLAAWILVRLLLAGSRRWRALLDRTLPNYVRGVRFRNFEVLSQAQLVGMIGSVLARVDLVAGLALFYAYITLVFSLFPWTQGWSYLLFSFASEQAWLALRSVGEAIPGLLMIAAIGLLFRWLVGLSDRFFDAVDQGTLTVGGFHPELARPSKRLMRILLWIIAVMIAYPYIPGGQSKAVQGVSILLGVMVSIGSTGFVGNVISGIVLTYSRSFRVGDRVRIGDQVGDVVSLGFFATKLRTIRNEEITLPNGQVASQAILNYTRLAEDPGLILHTGVTIGYDVDWRKVHALLIEAAGKVEGIEKEPAPWVFQRSLDDYYVAYELNCVTHLSHPQLKLYSRLHEEIQDAFARAGVEILSPAYHAIRDAHAMVLPQEPAGPRGEPGSFRVRNVPGA